MLLRMLLGLSGILVHASHHQNVCERAKHNHAYIKSSAERDLQKKYGCKREDRYQATYQHDPEMAFMHTCSF